MSKIIWPLQSRAALAAFYGDPDPKRTGKADPKWEDANIIKIVPPYPMVWSFDTDADGKADDPVTGIRVHKLCAKPLLAFLTGIQGYYGGDQAAIEKVNMHRFGGAYNFRTKRGNPESLSTHAFGCAWDMDPERNGFKQPYRPGVSIPLAVVALAKEQGADWGGDWSKGSVDAMHFQFGRIR